MRLTFQELVQSSDPVVCVLLVGGLEPHESALDVRLWRHWSEPESGIRADQAIIELPLGFTLIQCLVKHSQHSGEEASESSIENHVEKEDFCCKWERGTVSQGIGRVVKEICWKEVFCESLLLLGKRVFQANVPHWNRANITKQVKNSGGKISLHCRKYVVIINYGGKLSSDDTVTSPLFATLSNEKSSEELKLAKARS